MACSCNTTLDLLACTFAASTKFTKRAFILKSCFLPQTVITQIAHSCPVVFYATKWVPSNTCKFARGQKPQVMVNVPHLKRRQRMDVELHKHIRPDKLMDAEQHDRLASLDKAKNRQEELDLWVCSGRKMGQLGAREVRAGLNLSCLGGTHENLWVYGRSPLTAGRGKDPNASAGPSTSGCHRLLFPHSGKEKQLLGHHAPHLLERKCLCWFAKLESGM